MPKLNLSSDPIINNIVNRSLERSEQGIKTYGLTMRDNHTKTIGQWIDEAQQELADAIVYLEKVKETLGLFGKLNVRQD